MKPGETELKPRMNTDERRLQERAGTGIWVLLCNRKPAPRAGMDCGSPRPLCGAFDWADAQDRGSVSRSTSDGHNALNTLGIARYVEAAAGHRPAVRVSG